MAVTISGNPAVKDVNLTTTEETITIDPCFQIIFYADNDCLISIHDNQNYKRLTGGVAIPVYCSSGITKIYAKTTSGTAILGVWGMR